MNILLKPDTRVCISFLGSTHRDKALAENAFLASSGDELVATI